MSHRNDTSGTSGFSTDDPVSPQSPVGSQPGDPLDWDTATTDGMADSTDSSPDMVDTARDTAQQVTDQVGGMVQEKTDQVMDKAADGLGQATDMLRNQGEQRSGTMGTAATRTADSLDSASQYLREKIPTR